MADLPLNDVSDEDQGIPRPNAFRSHSFNPSQETTCTEETSETGVQTDTPTAEEAHDYFLISKQCLLPLFTRCAECGNKEIETGTFQSRTVGSALVVQWYCLFCARTIKWAYQPTMEGYYEGNLKLTSSVHTTGLPIPRLLAMGKEMGLALPCASTMRTQLAQVIMPAVDIVYLRRMSEVEAIVRAANSNRGIDLAVDGRYDSPGYCASNCTVSFIDVLTNYILSVVNMAKNMRGIDGASGRMEKEGVWRGLEALLAKRFMIKSIVTDNDAKISKMMREEDLFSSIDHHLDFWHLVKPIKKALREAGKLKKCPNTDYCRHHLVNHAYHVHAAFKDREKAKQYWMSALAHITGRHKHFQKVHFLKGIRRCIHRKLPPSREHQINRKSEEFRILREIILKPTFLAGLLRASPKKNTSPCETFNSLINLYAPKRTSNSPLIYDEKIKLVVMHANAISAADQVGVRKEKYSYSTRVRGRDMGVKRKRSDVDHYWRREVWEECEGVIREKKEAAFLKRNNIPDSNQYIAALAEEMEEREDEREEDSDVSIEFGGEYGDEVDSDSNPHMNPIMPSDGNESGAGKEEEEEEATSEMGEVEESSGSDWEKSEEEEEEAEKAVGGWRGRGRGRGRVRGRRRGSRGGVARRSMSPEVEEEEEEEEQPKKNRRPLRKREDRGEESSDPEYEQVKRGRKGA